MCLSCFLVTAAGLLLMCSTLAPIFGWKSQNSSQRKQQSSHGAKRWWMVDGGHCSLTIWSWMRQSQALWNGLDLLGSYWCPFWRSSCPTLEWTRLSWWLVPLQIAERLRLWNVMKRMIRCLPMFSLMFVSDVSCSFSTSMHLVFMGKQHGWPTATV